MKVGGRHNRRSIAEPAELKGELDIVRLIQSRAADRRARTRTGLQFGIGDDCAILLPKRGEEIVVTTDFSLEGRHFRRDWHSPQSIGHRALARGLSDIAAMGARPLAAFLSLALPKSVVRSATWLTGFLDGFLGLADRAKVPLAGGDTAEAPGEHVLADIVLLGAVPAGRGLRRDGAQSGDSIYVTGSLGGSFAQFEDLASEDGTKNRPVQDPLDGSEPHFFPSPRLRIGQYLLKKTKATAAIDLSDGLSTDLAHLCRASRLCAEVEVRQLPFHPLLKKRGQETALHAALHGGEDYELLFTAHKETQMKEHYKGLPVTRIGRMLSRKPGRPLVALVRPDHHRSPLQAAGWEHLR